MHPQFGLIDYGIYFLETMIVFQNWMEDLSTKDLRNDKQLKNLTLLLKCLKIMENATFLSKDNQVQPHLSLFFPKKFVTILFFWK